MRGFFLLNEKADPVTGQFVFLSQTPVAGDKVRLSARVYNYSTSVAFKHFEVKCSAVKYNRITTRKTDRAWRSARPNVSLDPRGNTAAQVIWDTTKFGPTRGVSQAYRIYVQLNYDGAIEVARELLGTAIGTPAGARNGTRDAGGYEAQRQAHHERRWRWWSHFRSEGCRPPSGVQDFRIQEQPRERPPMELEAVKLMLAQPPRR
jgi:hypothetical protein